MADDDSASQPRPPRRPSSPRPWWRRPWVWIIALPVVLVGALTVANSPSHQHSTAIASGVSTSTRNTVPTTTGAETTTPAPTTAPTTAPEYLAPPATSSAAVPLPAPGQPGQPSAALCGAPQNAMGYNYCHGSHITAPDPDTCFVFRCIENWSQGKGYLELCKDGLVSMSGGRSGSCADHEGDAHPVYQ